MVLGFQAGLNLNSDDSIIGKIFTSPVIHWGSTPLSDRPRILVFDGPKTGSKKSLEECFASWDVVRVNSLREGLALLHSQHFDGVFAGAREPNLWQRASSLLQTEY